MGHAMNSDFASGYKSTLSEDEIGRLVHWHERAYRELATGSPMRVRYLGLDIDVPTGVFAPTPVSDLLGSAVRREVRPEDRVLDMGTGSGINAILAAQVAREVIGVDINPDAVVAARRNAHANAVEDRTRFFESDVFESVSGTFDLIVFDPPFRWLKPRDMLERSMADEGYEALTRFMTQAHDRLRPEGRILLFFGTSGDLGYLLQLVEEQGFSSTVLASRSLEKDNSTVEYLTFRLVV